LEVLVLNPEETTLPPLRIDGSHDANAADGWQVLVCQAMPTTEDSQYARMTKVAI